MEKLTEVECREISQYTHGIGYTLPEVYEGIVLAVERILTARLTALQSAHEEEVKELERKVLRGLEKIYNYERIWSAGEKLLWNKSTQSVRDAFKEEGK